MTSIPLYFYFNNHNIFITVTLIIFTFLLYFSFKYTLSFKNINNQLLKDSTLLIKNKFSFNSFCEKNKCLIGFYLAINLDNLKKTDSFYDYHIENKITQKISSYLKKAINSKNHKIFRISDEKFMIFIKTEDELNNFLNNIELNTTECKILNKYNISVSIGIFNKTTSDTTTAFKYATLAMHEAKKKDGFSKFYVDSHFIKEKELENNLETILRGDLNQLFCLYQPKLNLISNTITEFEALARLNLNNEIISPNLFIPLAEKLKLIYKIDYKVAETSISLISKILKQTNFIDHVKISFNISISTLEREDFLSTITLFLKKYKLSGKYIEIELTESIFPKNFDLILKKVIQLQSLEIDVSLDDFTTGFSSSQLLALIPLQKVKLDKSLLNNYDTKKGKIIYTHLLNLISSLNIDIVAEGVETEEQLLFLKECNVKYAQGYLIGKPNFFNNFIKKS